MGEARRRKLAGNTEPDKQWHQRKAADKHAKKVTREITTVASENPFQSALIGNFGARKAIAAFNRNK